MFLRHSVARYLKGYPGEPIFAEYLKDKMHRTMGRNTFKFIDKYIKRKAINCPSDDVNSKEYDAFVIGSDQTWRCKYNPGRIQDMFLCFTDGWNVKRIAYAASFGTYEWEGYEEITKICSRAIKLFNLVTVRESSGVDICHKIFNVDAHHVLNPTLLLKRED